MPSAEFEPSNAGAQLNSQFLGNVDWGASMMERATRNAALLQQIDQQKLRFAQDVALSDQALQENRLRLTQLQGTQAVNAEQVRTDVALEQQKYQALQSNLQELQQASTELPSVLDAINAETDPFRLRDAAIAFHGRFSHLAQDPAFAPQYAALDGRLAARLQARGEEFRARISAAADGFRPHIDPANPDQLAAIRAAPLYPVARLDPNFAQQMDDATRESARLALRAAREPSAPAADSIVSAAPASPAAPAPSGSASSRIDVSTTPAAPTPAPGDAAASPALPSPPASPAASPAGLKLGFLTERHEPDGKNNLLGAGAATFDKDSVQSHSTDWQDVKLANDPATWAAFSGVKAVGLLRLSKLPGFKQVLETAPGALGAGLLSGATELQFKVDGKSINLTDWYGTVDTYLTPHGLQRVATPTGSGDTTRKLVEATISYRVRLPGGKFVPLGTTPYPFSDDMQAFLHKEDQYPTPPTSRSSQPMPAAAGGQSSTSTSASPSPAGDGGDGDSGPQGNDYLDTTRKLAAAALFPGVGVGAVQSFMADSSRGGGNPVADLLRPRNKANDLTFNWSSRNIPKFQPVHQIAIDRALPDLPGPDREILKAQQVLADKDQSPAHQYMHAMRDGKSGQTIAEARKLANDYVRDRITTAQRLEKDGDHPAALREFGLALHALQDGTSPVHVGFQPWGGKGSRSALAHVTSEREYPGDDSDLFRVTQKAWKYFTRELPLPEDFFPPTP